MNSFHFNFKTGNTVNPLELVKKFYVNPYMIEGFKSLNLHNICDDYNAELVIAKNDLPVIVMDIQALQLEQGFVKYNNEGTGGTITSENKVIYFKFTEVAEYIRIDTVLFRSTSNNIGELIAL